MGMSEATRCGTSTSVELPSSGLRRADKRRAPACLELGPASLVFRAWFSVGLLGLGFWHQSLPSRKPLTLGWGGQGLGFRFKLSICKGHCGSPRTIRLLFAAAGQEYEAGSLNPISPGPQQYVEQWPSGLF